MSGRAIENILVVDDEEGFRTMIPQALSLLGYTCQSAVNADQALESLDRHPCDLVISDIRMDGKDGLQLMKEALAKHPGLLFIIMTGHYSDYSYSEIVAAGASDFIGKPFDMEDLKARLERLSREQSAYRQLEEANAALARKVAINANIARLTRALTSPLSFEAISELVLECALELTNSRIGYAGYIDPKTGFLVSPTMSGNIMEQCKVSQPDLIFREFHGLWGWVLENRQAILSNDVKRDPRSCGTPEGHIPIVRFLSSPAMVQDGLIGQLAVANADRDYTEKDLKIIQQLADIYAVTVQRNREDEELRRTKDLLKLVLDSSAEAIGVFSRGGKVMEWNRAAAELFGYTRADLEARTVYDLYDDREALKTMLARLRAEGTIRRQEMSMRRKDGSSFFCELSINTLRDKDEKVIGSVTVALDLSDLKQSLSEQRAANGLLEEEVAERKRIEQELRELQVKLEDLVAERTAKLSRAGELIKKSIDRMQEISQE